MSLANNWRRKKIPTYSNSALDKKSSSSNLIFQTRNFKIQVQKKLSELSQNFCKFSTFSEMENSSGKWILVETFFQNGGILVEIFKGWILVEIFHEFFPPKFTQDKEISRKFLGWILVETKKSVHENTPKHCPREYTQGIYVISWKLDIYQCQKLKVKHAEFI